MHSLCHNTMPQGGCSSQLNVYSKYRAPHAFGVAAIHSLRAVEPSSSAALQQIRSPETLSGGTSYCANARLAICSSDFHKNGPRHRSSSTSHFVPLESTYSMSTVTNSPDDSELVVELVESPSSPSASESSRESTPQRTRRGGLSCAECRR